MCGWLVCLVADLCPAIAGAVCHGWVGVGESAIAGCHQGLCTILGRGGATSLVGSRQPPQAASGCGTAGCLSVMWHSCRLCVRGSEVWLCSFLLGPLEPLKRLVCGVWRAWCIVLPVPTWCGCVWTALCRTCAPSIVLPVPTWCQCVQTVHTHRNKGEHTRWHNLVPLWCVCVALPVPLSPCTPSLVGFVFVFVLPSYYLCFVSRACKGPHACSLNFCVCAPFCVVCVYVCVLLVCTTNLPPWHSTLQPL